MRVGSKRLVFASGRGRRPRPVTFPGLVRTGPVQLRQGCYPVPGRTSGPGFCRRPSFPDEGGGWDLSSPSREGPPESQAPGNPMWTGLEDGLGSDSRPVLDGDGTRRRSLLSEFRDGRGPCGVVGWATSLVCLHPTPAGPVEGRSLVCLHPTQSVVPGTVCGRGEMSSMSSLDHLAFPVPTFVSVFST